MKPTRDGRHAWDSLQCMKTSPLLFPLPECNPLPPRLHCEAYRSSVPGRCALQTFRSRCRHPDTSAAIVVYPCSTDSINELPAPRLVASGVACGPRLT